MSGIENAKLHAARDERDLILASDSLIVGKKATFIIATGGIYDAQTQMASFNFVEPYLRSVFGFLGVTDATFLTAGGTSVLNQGQDRNVFLAPHLQAVQTHAQTF